MIEEIDFKMEADYDWSPDTRLQGRADFLFLATDM